jgi:hypothetical protein
MLIRATRVPNVNLLYSWAVFWSGLYQTLKATIFCQQKSVRTLTQISSSSFCKKQFKFSQENNIFCTLQQVFWWHLLVVKLTQKCCTTTGLYKPGGRAIPPPILADHLTLPQLGGRLFPPHHYLAPPPRPPGFSDPPTALHHTHRFAWF